MKLHPHEEYRMFETVSGYNLKLVMEAYFKLHGDGSPMSGATVSGIRCQIEEGLSGYPKEGFAYQQVAALRRFAGTLPGDKAYVLGKLITHLENELADVLRDAEYGISELKSALKDLKTLED